MEAQIVLSSIEPSRVEATSRCWAASGFSIVRPARFVLCVTTEALPGKRGLITSEESPN